MSVSDALTTRFRPLLDFIARHEGTAKRPGGGYNTSLGYGRFTGGEKNLTAMTLDQIDALQTQMLAHPDNRFNSSALGRYQIVRRTLRGLRERFGLVGPALFGPDLQDRLAVALIQGRGRNPAGLRLEWASLTRVGDREILDAYDEDGSARLIAEHQLVAAGLALSLEPLTEQMAQAAPASESSPALPSPGLLSGDAAPVVTDATGYRIESVGAVDAVSLRRAIDDAVADGWELAQAVPVKKDILLVLKRTPASRTSLTVSPLVETAVSDAAHVRTLIHNGSTRDGLVNAWNEADRALREFPTNGCAAFLSALLRQSGIGVAMTVGAGALARTLRRRDWTRIDVGDQQPGDVGVAYDLDPTPPGADRVYLVIETRGPDEMVIADNQRRHENHTRFASGKGRTPTEYFLRAT